MQAEALAALRERIAALRAPPCDMAHEGIRRAADGALVRNAESDTGYARMGICPKAVRSVHLGCSHTMARHVLRDALEALPGTDTQPLLAELTELEHAISLLDHRRYDAETRRAAALTAASDATEAAREIASLVAEHRVHVARAATLRDAVLRRIDDALAVSANSVRQMEECVG